MWPSSALFRLGNVFNIFMDSLGNKMAEMELKKASTFDKVSEWP